MALNTINGFPFACGYPHKHFVPVASYFPLDNQESTTWFNVEYKGSGLGNHYSDAFITQYCDEQTVGIADKPDLDRTAFRAAWSPTGELYLQGLADGTHQLRVYDPQGRLVVELEVHSTAGRSASIPFTEHRMAVYVAVVDGELADRFIPAR